MSCRSTTHHGTLKLDQYTPTQLMNGVKRELEPTANKIWIWIQQDLKVIGLHTSKVLAAFRGVIVEGCSLQATIDAIAPE
jgi:hypothetical protein